MSTFERLIIVVRADPVICGHSGEARNLAEAAIQRGFAEVRILTWPLDRLEESGLPLKPMESVLPYSPGITVERPAPVGDERVPDGRYLAGLTGRLVELFTDGVSTLCLSLYLSPHTLAVAEAMRVARRSGLPVNVTTAAEAVGSDITNVVRTCVREQRFGAGAQVLDAYLDSDACLAVSEYTKALIVDSATELDEIGGTRYAQQCVERIEVSYPAIDTSAYVDLDHEETERYLTARGLRAGGYLLFLSRLAAAKGVDDLIDAYTASGVQSDLELIIAGRGPQAAQFAEHAAASAAADRITFLDDVGDAEKPHLMAGCAAFVLPSKPRPEFVETFGISLVEAMLTGSGPVITTDTGGISEAVGEHSITINASDPADIARAILQAADMTSEQRAQWAQRARVHALQFDRMNVFDLLIDRVMGRSVAVA